MKLQLPRLEAMLAKVLQAHGDRHGETLRELTAGYAPMKAELDAHLLKEERILFLMIRTDESHCGGVYNPIRVMLYEHDSAGDALVQMRRITADYTPPADACNTFR